MVLKVRSPRSSCQGWLGVGTLFLACKLAVFSSGPSSVSMERELTGVSSSPCKDISLLDHPYDYILSHQMGRFHKPLILIHQRAGLMKTTITES